MVLFGFDLSVSCLVPLDSSILFVVCLGFLKFCFRLIGLF